MRKISNDLQKKVSLTLGVLFSLTLAALLFFYAARPIMDPDFWWHLKTGQAMVQEEGLLESDPFTFHDNSEYATRGVDFKHNCEICIGHSKAFSQSK